MAAAEGRLVAPARNRSAIAGLENGVAAATGRLAAGVSSHIHRRVRRVFGPGVWSLCVLQRPELAKIIAENLHRFDGDRYHLSDFVVMPNHVHLLCCLIGKTDIEVQCRCWKRFTARKINALLKQSGRFWQEESFDHLVRSPEQFDRFRAYIADNPRRAKLRKGQFFHYRRQAEL